MVQWPWAGDGFRLYTGCLPMYRDARGDPLYFGKSREVGDPSLSLFGVKGWMSARLDSVGLLVPNDAELWKYPALYVGVSALPGSTGTVSVSFAKVFTDEASGDRQRAVTWRWESSFSGTDNPHWVMYQVKRGVSVFLRAYVAANPISCRGRGVVL